MSEAVLDTIANPRRTFGHCPPTQEYLDVTRELEKHHAIFYQVWAMGKPIFSDSIPTACVSMDRTRGGLFVGFYFNPDFWNSLTTYQRAFVIAHESLHILNNHGVRFFNKWQGLTGKLLNQATDIVINESLVNDFGFEREKINGAMKFLGEKAQFCFIDTCFKDHENILPNKSSEYYYNKLIEQAQKGLEDFDPNTFSPDDHDGHEMIVYDENDVPEQLRGKLPKLSDFKKKLNDKLTDANKKEVNEIIKKSCDSPKEKEKSQGGQQAGSGTGDFFTIEVDKPTFKKKWETIIFDWAKQEEIIWKKNDSFLEPNRRLVAFQNCKQPCLLPNRRQTRFIKKDLIDVWLFQDTSGSCIDLAPRFFKAAQSLDPKKFNVRMFCFDTAVYETDLKSGKIYGGGGTSFTCIEESILHTCSKESVPYPKTIFVITDGYGNKVNPKFAKRWYWFLTTSYKECIPVDSKIFNLEDYE